MTYNNICSVIRDFLRKYSTREGDFNDGNLGGMPKDRERKEFSGLLNYKWSKPFYETPGIT